MCCLFATAISAEDGAKPVKSRVSGFLISATDYYFPLLTLPEENRSIGYWGGKHLEYIRKHRPILFNQLVLSGKLKTYLADLNEQAQDRLELIMQQMKKAEGITEALKASDQMAWVRVMNSIRSRAEEIILREIIYGEDAI